MKATFEEVTSLAEEILKNIELGELPLASIVLKCARLARLTENQQAMDLFKYEMAGYPKDPTSTYIEHNAFLLAKSANRTFSSKDKNGVVREVMFVETVAELEAGLRAAEEQLRVAYDRNVAVSSANPSQYVLSPLGNTMERAGLRQIIVDSGKKLNQLKNGYYGYALEVLHEAKFGSIAEDSLSMRKISVDRLLTEKVPAAMGKIASIFDNLRSENPEDWAGAATSCRRLLKDVADALQPTDGQEIILENGDKMILTDERYIARMKEYIKNKKESKRFNELVGSHLDYIGHRLDAVYNAASKGTHADVTKEEAERYVVYCYLLVHDILSL